jgi:hypothetical protein
MPLPFEAWNELLTLQVRAVYNSQRSLATKRPIRAGQRHARLAGVLI